MPSFPNQEPTSQDNTSQEGTSSDESPRFEQALNELQTIVQRLNQSDLTLDEALNLYERGVHLANHGRTLLQHAEQRVGELRGALGTGDPNR